MIVSPKKSSAAFGPKRATEASIMSTSVCVGGSMSWGTPGAYWSSQGRFSKTEGIPAFCPVEPGGRSGGVPLTSGASVEAIMDYTTLIRWRRR